MKKKSKAIGKDYTKLDRTHASYQFEYYGIILKDNRVKIDTKRYKKFLKIPNKKIEKRHSVYYLPTKIHRSDYKCNWFRDLFSQYKKLWFTEYKNFIDSIKTPTQIEKQVLVANMFEGTMDIDEAKEKSIISGSLRQKEYKMIIKSLYAQFFHQLMSSVDALCLKMLTSCGYKEEDYTKKQFDIFIQGLQGKKAIPFKDFENYSIYDKAFTLWNFLKHNSLRSYKVLKQRYPTMIWDPNENYQNGESALTVAKIDEKFIIYCLDNMHLFFDELCEKAFQENVSDAQWDYDDYFYNEVKKEIDLINNPLDI